MSFTVVVIRNAAAGLADLTYVEPTWRAAYSRAHAHASLCSTTVHEEGQTFTVDASEFYAHAKPRDPNFSRRRS